MLIRQHKPLIKGKRVKDKEEQEGRPDIIITTATAMREVGVVEGGQRKRNGQRGG